MSNILSLLNGSQRAILNALGVNTEEQFNGLLFAVPEAVTDALQLRSMTKMMNLAPVPEVDDSTYGRFLKLVETMSFKGMPEAKTIPLMLSTAADLPSKVQIEELHAIRDQANRGTCVAHATTAAFENLNIREGSSEQKKIDFSEQFCYWATKQKDGHPNSDGSWAKICFPALKEFGICHEEHWKYNPNPTNDPGQGPPPAAAQKCAPNHKADYLELNSKDINALKTQLGKEKRVISFGVPVFNSSMRNQDTVKTGRFVMPIKGESPVGGHEMALIGYVDDKSRPGGGDFILRNSWGTKWAHSSPFGAGNGSVPYAYIAEHCMEALVFTKLLGK